jgi:hypothetical protein
MIGQYLPNNNENTTVSILLKILHLNRAWENRQEKQKKSSASAGMMFSSRSGQGKQRKSSASAGMNLDYFVLTRRFICSESLIRERQKVVPASFEPRTSAPRDTCLTAPANWTLLISCIWCTQKVFNRGRQEKRYTLLTQSWLLGKHNHVLNDF